MTPWAEWGWFVPVAWCCLLCDLTLEEGQALECGLLTREWQAVSWRKVGAGLQQEGVSAGSAWLLWAVAHGSQAPATEVRLFRPQPVATWEWESFTKCLKVADELLCRAPLQMVGLDREQVGPLRRGPS